MSWWRMCLRHRRRGLCRIPRSCTRRDAREEIWPPNGKVRSYNAAKLCPWLQAANLGCMRSSRQCGRHSLSLTARQCGATPLKLSVEVGSPDICPAGLESDFSGKRLAQSAGDGFSFGSFLALSQCA
jgi:hypothetical protein